MSEIREVEFIDYQFIKAAMEVEGGILCEDSEKGYCFRIEDLDDKDRIVEEFREREIDVKLVGIEFKGVTEQYLFPEETGG